MASLPRWVRVLLALLVVGNLASLWMAWSGEQRLQLVEKELVRRQQEAQNAASEARLLAKEARDGMRDTAARAALLEVRVAEVALQRTQLEELIQSLSRSRDENLIIDIDAALRVAQQQAALTGSAEPLVAALKAADERIARLAQPRLEGVRRALARDLERAQSTGVTDIATLVIRVDEVMRLADELPLLRDRQPEQTAERRRAARAGDLTLPPTSAGHASAPAAGQALDASASEPAGGWLDVGRGAWERLSRRVWDEVRSLIRVTRVDRPEGMLIAPEQAFFLRENLKLKLLNARAALLSRQFAAAQGDLRAALDVLPRYFDAESRKTRLARELLQQVLARSTQVSLPRPDDTLAAIATLGAGR